MLEQFDISVADSFYDLRCHFRNFLSGFTLEAIFHQPFADELLGKLLLRFPFGETILVSF